ncbi:MAG: invasin domain 3-containing protein [Balneolaceae bacterium]
MRASLPYLFTIGLFVWSFSGNIQAQTVTPATGGTGISADNFATGTWTTLTGPVITETSPGQLQPGDIRFRTPSGFIWDTGGTAPSVVVDQPKGNKITVTFSSRSSSEIVFSVSGTSAGSPPNNPHTLTFSGFRLRPAQGTPLASGEIRNAGSSAPGGTRNYGSVSMVAGADNKIRVESASNSSGTVVSSQNVEAGSSITVYSNVRDQFNNFKRNETATWSLQSETGGVVSGDLSPSGNSAIFTGELVGTAVVGATFGGLTPTPSATISVIPSDPSILSISTQPSTNATAGATFSIQPVIEILDAYSNILTGDDFTQITASRNTGAGTLQGNTTVTVNDGIATFTNLFHTVANEIDLSFSADGFTPVVSNTIPVDHALADSLIFIVQPSNGSRNTAITPPIELQVVDEFVNYVDTAGISITLDMASEDDGNISGNTSSSDVNGLVTFNNVSFNQVGPKTIIASAAGLDSSEVSNSFTIANAGRLAGFQVEISGGGNIANQVAGSPFNLKITAVDGAGSLLDGNQGRDNFTGNVDLTTNSEFSGATTVTNVGPFVDGVFDPHSVELISAGDGVTVTATNGSGSESGNSNTFTVNPSSADADSSSISVSEETLIADGVSETQITVILRDEFGNNLLSGGDDVQISGTGSSTISSVTDNSDGTYSATLIAPNNVGSTEISATVNSSPITSGNPIVTFTFNELATFLIETEGGGSIGSQTAGTPFNIKITAKDAFNNIVTTFNGTGSTVNITSTGTLFSGSGTTATFSNGVLLAHAVTITSIGPTTISARKSASTETGSSNSFIVNPNVADETTSTITSSQSYLQNDGIDNATITVQLKDSYGNNLSTGGDAVTLSSTSGSLSSVTDNLNGTYSATLTAGLASTTATITGTVNSEVITDNAQVVITQFNVWQGEGGGNPASRTDWGTAGNWSLGSLPATGQVIIVESGATYYPIIDGEDPVIDFLTIQSGGNVAVTGREITINSEISGLGSFSGNNSIINLAGDSKISNFISGSSVVNLIGSSTQFLEGDFTSDILNIQNNISSNGYLEAFSEINIETGNTLTMTAGSKLVALGNITVTGELVANNSTFNFSGNITGTNFTLINTSVYLVGSQLQEINGINNIKSFTLDNPEGAIVNNDLTVTDTLFITNGFLTIASGNSFVSNKKSGNTSNIRMQREISGNRGWRLLSAPLISSFDDFLDGAITQGYPGAFYSTGTEPGDTLQPNVLYYDETYPGTDNQRWRAPGNASNTVTTGGGYFVFFFDDVPDDGRYNQALPDTLEIQGEENDGNGTDFTFPVTYSASADTGWNLVGNPFMATIDWDDGNWTKTNMDNAIYVWDPSTNDYLVWNGTTGSLGDGTVSPFQAFWVKANGNGSPSLKVNKTSKTTGGIFKKERAGEPVIELALKASGMEKMTHISFSSGGSTGKDSFDAYRLLPFNSDTYLELFSLLKDGTELAINNMPRNFGIPIEIPIHIGGFISGKPVEGEVDLSWNGVENIPSGWEISLVDKQFDKTFSLLEPDDYSFRLQASSNKTAAKQAPASYKLVTKSKAKAQNARFVLRIEPGDDAEGLPDTFQLSNNYPNPFNAQTTFEFATPLEGPVSINIFDILGRKAATLVNDRYPAGYHRVNWNANSMASGVYFAIFQAQNNRIVKKLTLIK